MICIALAVAVALFAIISGCVGSAHTSGTTSTCFKDFLIGSETQVAGPSGAGILDKYIANEAFKNIKTWPA